MVKDTDNPILQHMHIFVMNPFLWYISPKAVMNSNTKCKPSVRPLFAWEIREARRVFADQLRYERVRIHECAGWPNTVNMLGMRLKRMPPDNSQNAITIGYHCYFPEKLAEKPVAPDHSEHYKICWLIHELTHVWQFQCLGWRYLPMALNAQFSFREMVYEFGGEAGLIAHHNEGWKLSDFNLEQQGDIASSYYRQLREGKDISAWLPFIKEIQQAT